MRAVNKMDQKCLEHALGNALGPKSGPINAQICTLPPVRWKVKAPTSPSKASKRAKSGTRIKVLVVLDGFYRRGPTIELSPGRSQQNVVLGRLLDVL